MVPQILNSLSVFRAVSLFVSMSIVSFTFCASADLIKCEANDTIDDLNVPQIEIDTTSLSIQFTGDLYSRGSLTGRFAAGTYPMEKFSSTKLRLDMGTSELFYSCNHEATFFNFDTADDILTISVHCDGASGFAILSVPLVCAHY